MSCLSFPRRAIRTESHYPLCPRSVVRLDGDRYWRETGCSKDEEAYNKAFWSSAMDFIPYFKRSSATSICHRTKVCFRRWKFPFQMFVCWMLHDFGSFQRHFERLRSDSAGGLRPCTKDDDYSRDVSVEGCCSLSRWIFFYDQAERYEIKRP
jgi:hypothetical protein